VSEGIISYDERDRVVIEIRFLTDQPISVRRLGEAFIALDDMFQAQLMEKYPELTAHLAIREVEKGSQIYQIVAEGLPIIVMMSYQMMIHTVAIADFYERLAAGISAFVRPTATIDFSHYLPQSKAETKGIEQLLRTVAGKRGAGLGLRKLRYKDHTKERLIDVEMEFGQDDVNFASTALANYVELPSFDTVPQTGVRQYNEVILELQQANISPGKQGGRTGDKGIVRAVSPKECPVYFRDAIQDLKQRMIRGDDNPFEMLYVVSISATLN
jgi:hypothetical protein